MSKHLTAIIQAEPPGFVALCPELDVASQGDSIEQSLANLREAVELFYESASPTEISAREGGEIFVTQLEVSVG
jgi:predicted RNase H-like HicB family nuclease